MSFSRREVLAASFLLGSCGRYGDFHLPVAGGPEKGSFVWEPRSGPVLERGASGEWDSADVLNPSVLNRAGTYYNFYSGFDGRVWHTGLATSVDGLGWTRKGRVLSPQGWEGDYIAANGSALLAGDEILYWYQAGKPPRIALARSLDGLAWTKHPRAVLDAGPRGSWDERGVADPYVVLFGGVFYLFYLGQDRARRQRLGLARSNDGIVWTKLRANPLLELGGPGAFDENGLGEPAVWFSNGSYWMLYTGRDRNEYRRMGLARSRDGARWEKLASPVIAGGEAWNGKVVCDGTVEVTAQGVRVWFGGGDLPRPDERLNGQIGYGFLRWRS
ncbi:MAG: hypothetical protein IANPNBLG_03688 [Bryobacteraceae bacterium]|nr:hypothetical protein [Bryobacteraceae bacterium]